MADRCEEEGEDEEEVEEEDEEGGGGGTALEDAPSQVPLSLLAFSSFLFSLHPSSFFLLDSQRIFRIITIFITIFLFFFGLCLIGMFYPPFWFLQSFERSREYAYEDEPCR